MVERRGIRAIPLGSAERGNSRRLLPVVCAWGVILGAFRLYTWHEMLSAHELIARSVEICRASPLGPLLFISTATLSPLLLLPAALLGGVAGLCFGPALGILYTLIGCNLSALLTYTLGRLSWRAEGRVARLCERYGERLQQNQFLGVLLLRLSFLPYDPINFLIGLLRIPVGPFLLANTLGSLPGVFVIVLAGNAVGGIEHGLPAISPGLLLTAIALVTISVACAWLLRRRAGRAV